MPENVEESTKKEKMKKGYPRKYKQLSTTYQQNVDKLVKCINKLQDCL